eukprot:CAMPEP_0178952808 /NCGR_PEP_ID=MMETSP0789-20121207/8058_1 /TAXON_ID=3005 /ORGANISM="Rhizosolenia setigera, Strain CCMP 1694" /LENGTH=301 /DNA_ID=CAMNT_0020633975 /DNA_START=104 /DNA_END=1006 /DNA_ORIENTATION=-
MEPSRSKRRRLVSVSPYVSLRPRPDVPARFESLNDDTLTTVLELVGDKSYKSFGGLNKRCKEVYLTSGMTKETFVYGYAPLSVIRDTVTSSYAGRYATAWGEGVVFHNRSDVMVWALEERKKMVLRAICDVAAEEGRLDILKEVFNNNIDDGDIRFIFGGVNTHAAQGGKLNVLKWAENKELRINKRCCAEKAAEKGQLHIIQWLREKKGLELFGGLYNKAIDGDRFIVMKRQGGHLHVMKWLRENKVPWNDWTFYRAALYGNLDVLQYLHDEGCPWPRSVQINEEEVTPEVIEWLRVNGY